MLHGMYLSSLTMGRPKLPFTLIPTLPTTPHPPWKRGSMKSLPLNHWKSLSHYFFEGTFCLISLFSPSGRLIIDKLVLLMMYHRSCCFSSLFFCLFHSAADAMFLHFHFIIGFFSARISLWFFYMISLFLSNCSFCSCIISLVLFNCPPEFSCSALSYLKQLFGGLPL